MGPDWEVGTHPKCTNWTLAQEQGVTSLDVTPCATTVPKTGLEPARGVIPTRPSTWRVCQFRHFGIHKHYFRVEVRWAKSSPALDVLADFEFCWQKCSEGKTTCPARDAIGSGRGTQEIRCLAWAWVRHALHPYRSCRSAFPPWSGTFRAPWSLPCRCCSRCPPRCGSPQPWPCCLPPCR